VSDVHIHNLLPLVLIVLTGAQNAVSRRTPSQADSRHRTWQTIQSCTHTDARTDDVECIQQVLSLGVGQFLIEYYEQPSDHRKCVSLSLSNSTPLPTIDVLNFF
jgi:hypothetical protein